MRFSEYIGQETVLADLRQAVARDRIGHAYLLVGPEGVGRRTLALLFAQALLCEAGAEQPCEACRSCTLAKAGTHPDLRMIEPDGTSFRIEQIRALRHLVAQKAVLARRRVFVLADMDRLSEAAANAFLLTLEEPPPGVVFIGWALAGESLPETVISRCQVIKLQPLADSRLVQALRARGIDAERAEEICARAGGLPGAALQALEREMAADGEDLLGHLMAADLEQALRIAEDLAQDNREAVGRRLAGLARILGEAVKARACGLAPAEEALADVPREALWRLRQAAAVALGHLEANANLRLLLDVLALAFYAERAGEGG